MPDVINAAMIGVPRRVGGGEDFAVHAYRLVTRLLHFAES